ncbi:CACTA en-spm transposon protein [Cucumis melo var. makuwa]|uniref:CACTA en-spm transposon protein n=1 Tax=Cucumis melo var. makuwa TaxID=1194695 RepID=A0A5D3BPH5_CUCMM|nr:CACTA en-spm transposon protein [Cucumis melo var. makuwa]
MSVPSSLSSLAVVPRRSAAFEDDLDNIAGGSLSEGDNAGPSSQQPATLTFRIRAQSRLLELEHHVAINGRIPMTIAPRAKFVEHQMFTTFKEFQVDCHRYFKKYSDSEEARANPPNALVGHHGDWLFLYDHYMSRAFQRNTRRAGTFMSQAVDDAHNQMLELQSQPTPEGSQPLSEDEICNQVLDRQPGYSKGLGWDPSRRPAGRRVRAVPRHLFCNPYKER